jgi:hypothetical protein
MFRFTIRELVLLTVIVAVGAGWWVERRRLSREVFGLKYELLLRETKADELAARLEAITGVDPRPPSTDADHTPLWGWEMKRPLNK